MKNLKPSLLPLWLIVRRRIDRFAAHVDCPRPKRPCKVGLRQRRDPPNRQPIPARRPLIEPSRTSTSSMANIYEEEAVTSGET